MVGITVNGTVIDVQKIAKIAQEQEKSAFKFTASDFTFETDGSGKWIFDALSRTSTPGALWVDVKDPANGVCYFRGDIDVEGTPYDPEKVVYSFTAYSNLKRYALRWESQMCVLKCFDKNEFPDPLYYLASTIAENTGLPVEMPLRYRRSVNYLAHSFDVKISGYTVANLLSDAAKFMNAVFYLRYDENGLEHLTFVEREIPNNIRPILLDRVTEYGPILRAADYTKVIFDTDKGNIAIETLEGLKIVGAGETVDTKGALDLRFTEEMRAKMDFGRNGDTIYKNGFDVLFPRRAERRQGIWDYLMKTKIEHACTVDYLMKIEPYDRIFLGEISAQACSIEYNLIDEETLIHFNQYVY